LKLGSEHIGDETECLRLVSFDVPVLRCSLQHVLHRHLRALYQVLESFVLDVDGGLDLVQRRLQRGNACRQRAIDSPPANAPIMC
jgi:hypothetical protein